jgi:hypothetical protein
VTTLEREVGRPIPMPVVRDAVARNLARALGVKLAEDP